MKESKHSFSITKARDENLVGEALGEARRAAGMTREKLSAALKKHGLSISPYGITKWEQGTRTPSAYQMMALCHVLHIHNPLDMYAEELNSIGLKKLADYRDDLIASGRYAPAKPALAEIEYIDMPVSYLAASAGTGMFLDDGNYEVVSVPRNSVPAGAVLGIRVSGDSMEPVYADGQIVWIAQSETLRPGEVGIFAYDGDGYIKVYDEREPDPEDVEAFTDAWGNVHKQPVLISYNKKYPPKPISSEASFQIVGRVLN